MVPFASYKEHHDTNITETGGTRIPRLLNSTVVFGPNGSGKTNLFMAIDHLQKIVSLSHSNDNVLSIIEPHALSSEDEPTDFTILFLQEENVYKYSVSVNFSRITYEALEVMEDEPRRKLSPLFIRNGDDISFGTKMKGDKKSIFKMTRSKTLYLSALEQWNNPIADKPFRWFRDRLRSVANLTGRENAMLGYTLQQVTEQPEKNNSVLEIMNSSDTGVVKLDIERSDDHPNKGTIEDIRNFLQQQSSDYELDVKKSISWKIIFEHQIKNSVETKNKFEVNYQRESRGTQKLFAVSGPLLDVLEHGYILAIDELDSSLHPHLTAAIISMFNDPEINTRGAQLIFNTHDIVLMDPELFRRDQIWFTEKGEDGGSTLTPLLDYSPRNNEPLGANYLSGVYNAIPFIQDKFMTKRKSKANGEKISEETGT